MSHPGRLPEIKASLLFLKPLTPSKELGSLAAEWPLSSWTLGRTHRNPAVRYVADPNTQLSRKLQERHFSYLLPHPVAKASP